MDRIWDVFTNATGEILAVAILAIIGVGAGIIRSKLKGDAIDAPLPKGTEASVTEKISRPLKGKASANLSGPELHADSNKGCALSFLPGSASIAGDIETEFKGGKAKAATKGTGVSEVSSEGGKMSATSRSEDGSKRTIND